MKRLLTALAAIGLLATCSLPALATVVNKPKLRLVDIPTAAKNGEQYDLHFEFIVPDGGLIEHVQASGDGWSIRAAKLQPAAKQFVGTNYPLTVTATPADSANPLIVEFTHDGHHYRDSFQLDKASLDAERLPGEAVEFPMGKIMPFPGVKWETIDSETSAWPKVAPRDRDPSLQTIFDASNDEGSGEARTTKKKRSIRVYGRFVYERSDGLTLGGDNVKVWIYDEDTVYDDELAQGLTDEDGYFDISFTWDPCFVCEDDPDIYLEFELDNHRVQVQSPTLEIDYSWVSGTRDDYTGSSLNVGWRGPSKESHMPSVFIFNNAYRAWRYIQQAQGLDTDTIDVLWPESGTSAYYNGTFEEMHVAPDRQWWDDTITHEYGHHWTENFSYTESPDYCNGLCDTPGEWDEFWIDDCGHCMWCPESLYPAWNEGFANWLADKLTRYFDSRYVTTLRNRNMETINVCDKTGNTLGAPNLTEGAVAALLRDIEDSTNEADSSYPGGLDMLSLGTDEIFSVVDANHPESIWDFLTAFQADFPELCEQLWFTGKNNGFDWDAFPPSVVTSLSAPNHVLGVASPDNTIEFSWNTAFDDCSGIAGYGLTLGSIPSIPSATQDVGDVNSWTSPQLVPGTYYLSVRAVDNSGKWSASYLSLGPIIIREPLPANLVFDKSAGWEDFVVPRSMNDSSPSIVAAPVTLQGNGNYTYWNMRTKNIGESSAGAGSRIWTYSDGRLLLDPFNISPYIDQIANLGPNTVDNSINKGPISMGGGRHTFGARIDYDEVIAETDETDNRWARQWVWSPLDLITDVPISKGNPPDRDGGWEYATGSLWYNNLGLRFSSTGWWNAVVLSPDDAADDFDARLHQASTGPQDGFAANVGWSTRGPGCTDAVFVNRNVTGSITDWDVGILQSSGDRQSGTYNSVHRTSASFAYGDSVPLSMVSGEVLKLREFFVSSANVGPTSIVLDSDPADGPIHIMWLDSNFSTGDMLDYDAIATSDPITGRASIEVNIATQSYHCAVVYRDMKDGTGPIDFVLEIGPTLPDWKPLKPNNWHAAVVPHPFMSDTSTLPSPSTLPGNSAATYISLSILNDGAGGVTTPVTAFTQIDGVAVTGSVWPAGWPGNFQRVVHEGSPVSIRGGRHTLTLVCDPLNAYEEIFESNNIFGEQWIWTPLQLSTGTLSQRLQPPSKVVGWSEVSSGEALWFNADGLRLPGYDPAPNDQYWAIIAAMSENDSDVDIRLHEASFGAKSGFAANLALSGWGSAKSEYILINLRQTPPRDFDVGVLDQGGSGGYFAQSLRSQYVGEMPAGSMGPIDLESRTILDLHDIHFEAGSYTVYLENHSPDVDLGLSLHRADAEFVSKSDAIAASWFRPAGDNEWISFDIPTADFYGLSVWRVSRDDLLPDASYTLSFLDGITDVPPSEREGLHNRLASVHPNPFNPRTQIAYELDGPAHTRLAVYSMRGELVRVLVDEMRDAGRHEVVWDGRDDSGHRMASGTYFLRMTAGESLHTQKMMLIK